MNTGPIRFAQREAALAVACSEARREQFERESILFLRPCKARRSAATIEEAIYTHVMKKPGLGVRSPLDRRTED